MLTTFAHAGAGVCRGEPGCLLRRCSSLHVHTPRGMAHNLLCPHMSQHCRFLNSSLRFHARSISTAPICHAPRYDTDVVHAAVILIAVYPLIFMSVLSPLMPGSTCCFVTAAPHPQEGLTLGSLQFDKIETEFAAAMLGAHQCCPS